MEVTCKNKERGCEWTGTAENMLGHLRIECQMEVSQNEEEPLVYFSNLPRSIIVTENVVSMQYTSKTHQFAISSLAMDKTIETKWQCEIVDSIKGWIGFGVCDKKKLMSNKMRFFFPGPDQSHGCFLFSSNKVLWNSNVKEEDNTRFIMHDLEKGDKISFRYLPLLKVLEFDTGKYQGKLTNVAPILDKELHMCLVFLHGGNSIRVIY